MALLLRLDPTRTFDDIDIAYSDAAGRHEVALAALEQALALGTGDNFSFVVRPPGAPAPDAGPDETLALRVEALIGGRRWLEFGIDRGYADDVVPTGSLAPREDPTGLPEVEDIHADRLPAHLAAEQRRRRWVKATRAAPCRSISRLGSWRGSPPRSSTAPAVGTWAVADQVWRPGTGSG